MASNKRKKTTVRKTSNPLRIQKKINEDYVELARDYKKLGGSLWGKPTTKYVLGGIGLGLIAPFLWKAFQNIPAIETFFDSASEKLKDKWAAVTHANSSIVDGESHTH